MADFPDYKNLKKLADSCRKAGIKSFKGFGMEFTLTDDAPQSAYKLSKSVRKAAPELTPTTDGSDAIETDSLSDDELMMWSSTLSNDVDRLKQ